MDYSNIQYEILKCKDENKRTDANGNIMPISEGGDPDCSSDEEI